MNQQVIALRVSDQDRYDVLDVLAAALVEGRLDRHEHEVRSERALRASTAYELSVVTADLPVPTSTRAEQERRDLKDWLEEWRYWLGGAVIMSGIRGARVPRRES